MRRGYNTSEVDDLLVWVPDTLLPAGMVQLLTKKKPKRKRTVCSKNTNPRGPPTFEKDEHANDSADSDKVVEISLAEYEANAPVQKRKRRDYIYDTVEVGSGQWLG